MLFKYTKMFENTISYTKLTNIDLDSDLMLKMNENVKLSFNNKKIILIFFFLPTIFPISPPYRVS